MMKETVSIYKIATTMIIGIAMATLLQAGITFANNKDQPLKPGTIRVQQEESAYPDLATITLEQAKDVALANVQGEILKIELEDENGFLVYGVEIVTPEKILTDVKIDAGSGKVLRIDKDAIDHNGDSYDQSDNNDRHDDGAQEDNDHEDRD